MIKTQDMLNRLGFIVFFFALIAALVGVFYQQEIDVSRWTNVFNQEVLLYQKGIYAYDSIMIGAASRGTDIVLLTIGLPLLLFTLFLQKTSKSYKELLLVGIFSYFVYLYGTFTLSIVFNQMFLVYVVIFGCSFYGFVYGVIKCLNDYQVSINKKTRWIGWLLIIIGVMSAMLWLLEPIMAITQNQPHYLAGYPTLFTHGLDLAIIIPASIVSGIYVLKSSDKGLVLAVPILAIMIMLFPNLIIMTMLQISAGLMFTIAELMGMVVSFLIMGVFSLAAVIQVFQHIKPKHYD